MSKRSHHRSSGININELAEALTQRGWQPPRQGNPMQPMMNGMGAMGGRNNGGDPFAGNLQTLSGLLGTMNNGNLPPMYPNQMPNQNRAQNPTTDKDLLQALFQQVLKELRNN